MLKKPPKFYIRATDAAKLLGCHRMTVVKMIERGELKGTLKKAPTKAGYRWQILYDDVIKLLQS